MTYSECWQQIDAIGRGLLSLDLKKNEAILIFAETRREWLLAAFAAFRHGFPLVTLYPTLGEDALKHAADQTQVSTIFISHDLLPKLNVSLPSPPPSRLTQTLTSSARLFRRSSTRRVPFVT